MYPVAHSLSTISAAANTAFAYRQGAQGTYDTASKVELAAEFDTENADEALLKILELGSMQTVEVSRFIHQIKYSLLNRVLMLLALGQMPGRQGVTNESMSSMRVK